MNIVAFIKKLINKFMLWLKKIKNKKKKGVKLEKIKDIEQKKNGKVTINHLYNDNQSNSIGGIYPKININELNILNNKIYLIRRKVINTNNEPITTELKLIDEITTLVNKRSIYDNQIDNIITLMDNVNNDKNFELNTPLKLELLKNNISDVISEKLSSYEEEVVEKAYKEYNKVNYIIVTTLLIDDIINEINDVQNDINNNKYEIYKYVKIINSILEKIRKLEKINNKKEVGLEIERLRNDLYTKKKDKYDLLYNEEVFINLTKQCTNIISSLEKESKISEIKEEKRIKEEKQKKENEKVEKQQKKEKKEKQLKEEVEELEREEYYHNILKRFIDLQLAHNLLMKKEVLRKKKEKVNYTNELFKAFTEFLTGEYSHFNFERNKTKLEIAKLYNDINYIDSCILNKPYIPLEHINFQLDTIIVQTLEKKFVVESIIEAKTNQKITSNDTSLEVNNKLENILSFETKKAKGEEKTLKKDFSPNQTTYEKK